MERPMLPIGVSNFGKLVRYRDPKDNGYLFIDKTLFIKEYIYSGDEIALITRPRRFGKTLNMSMLQHFFAEKINGIPTKGLFDNLKISKHPEVMEHQGKYPVIFLTLKEIRGKDFKEAFDRFKNVSKFLFKQFDFLLANSKIDQNSKNTIKSILNGKASQGEYEVSLYFLSNLLYIHYGKKVMVLIDEYDTPLHDAYVNDYYEDMRGFIASMFGKAFKGNDYLHKAIITGILKIAKSSLFSELNNVEIYSCISSPLYGQYFGFTEDETEEFLQKAALPKKIKQLKEMYNGYKIEDFTLYNPFSIVSFIKNATIYGIEKIDKALQPYWINSGGTQIIANLIKNNVISLEEGMNKLINNESISTPINPDIILGSSLRTDKISFWSLMFIAGYLKIINKFKNDYGDMQYEVLFPNEEIRKSMQNLMLEAVGEANSYNYTLAMQSLVEGKISEFKTFLEDYMRYTPSYFDTSDRYKEQFYHGLLLGMAACLSKLYIVKSNRESGNGRYDIAIEPRDIKRKGVIIELKAANEGDDLNILAEEALEQIQTKSYKTEMQQRGIEDITPLGIAFKRDDVVVKY